MKFRMLLSFAVAAIAFAFTMDVRAATIAVGTALNHSDALDMLTQHGAGIGAVGIGAMAIGSTKPTEVKLAASKLFRVAVEGATTDGRVIERSWLEQMAANYSPTKYGARVNLEHIVGILPDSPFKAYGDVIALETQELDGEFAGKLGLYARIDPTADLVALTKAKQKIYTSCEIDPSFADTKQAYLVGLAVTDTPASLGTEILSFCAKNPAASPFGGRKKSATNLFTVAEETTIEFEEAEQTPALAVLLSKVKELLTGTKKKETADDTRFTELAASCVELATHAGSQATRIEELSQQVAELLATQKADREAFDELHMQLSKTDGSPNRPASTGKAGAQLTTDC